MVTTNDLDLAAPWENLAGLSATLSVHPSNSLGELNAVGMSGDDVDKSTIMVDSSTSTRSNRISIRPMVWKTFKLWQKTHRSSMLRAVFDIHISHGKSRKRDLEVHLRPPAVLTGRWEHNPGESPVDRDVR